MTVYVISSFRGYEDEERYFGVDGVFTDPRRTLNALNEDLDEQIFEERSTGAKEMFICRPTDEDVNAFLHTGCSLRAELDVGSHHYSWVVERKNVTDGEEINRGYLQSLPSDQY